MADFDGLVSNTVAVFTELPFDLLEEEWIELAWNSKYTDVLPPDINFDHLDDGNCAIIDQALAACEVCQEWFRLYSLDDDGDDSDRLWKTLMDNGVHCKTLLGLLYGVISQGTSVSSNLTRKNIALRFAKLYFNLLLVPGSTAYRIFQESLFQLALQCFRQPSKRSTPLLGNDTGSRGSSQATKKQSGRRKQSTQQEDADFLEPSGSPDVEELSEQALSEHMTFMTDSLRDLVLMLQSFSLQPYIELTEYVVQQLCELTQVDIPGSHVRFDISLDLLQSRHYHYRNLPTYAYAALKLLCLPLHGDPSENFRSIAKHLMPHILMHRAGNVSTVSRQFLNVRDHAVSFVTTMVDESSDDNREGFEEVVHVLIHNVALQAVDKTDFRVKTSQAIATLMRKLSEARHKALVEWFERLMLSPHSSKRVFALEMISALIWNERVVDSRESLLLGVMRRCNDKASTVKTKALGVLAAVSNESPVQWLPLLQGAREENGPAEDGETDSGCVAVEDDRSVQMMQMLMHRVDDSKVHVRRTALVVLENVLCAGGEFLKEEYVKALQEKCVDPAVLVRKQALQCLTRCLQAHSHCTWLQHLWLGGALPSVFDAETSVQEKAVEVVECALLAPLCAAEGNGSSKLSWSLLEHLAGEQFLGYHKYLQKAIAILARIGKLRHGMLKRLKPYISGPNDSSAWLLLSKLSLFCDLGEAEFALKYWKQVCTGTQHPNSSETLHCVLLVIRKTAHHLSQVQLKELIVDFERQLRGGSLCVETVPKAVDCLCAFMWLLHKNEEEEGQKAITNWGKATLHHCSDYLSPLLLEQSTKLEDCSEDELIHHLVLLGEASQAAPTAVTNHMQLLVQSCLSATVADTGAAAAEGREHSPRKKPKRQRHTLVVTSRIRAHAFVALGKMCLQNEEFAKKVVAAVAKELELSDDLVIRNNVIVILSDLCKRYAILVDPYLPYVTACLKDHEPELRHLTLESLFQLLKQDFIKLKGSLFYRLLTTLVDDSKLVQELATYGLGCQVHTRHPHIFYQKFIETMYHFNDFQKNQTLARDVNDPPDPFSMSGLKNFERRSIIYKFMLEHVTDEERFKLNLSITQNILAPCADKDDTLIRQCPFLLRDALAVLCFEEIKLQSIVAQEEAAEDDVGQAILLAAKKSILSSVVKQNVLENVVPVVIALKRRLEDERSPLLRHLLLFLRDLMRDYKNEVKEILSLDKTTASEVAFDLKRLEEDNAAKGTTTGMAAVQGEEGSAEGATHAAAVSTLQQYVHNKRQVTSQSAVDGSVTGISGEELGPHSAAEDSHSTCDTQPPRSERPRSEGPGTQPDATHEHSEHAGSDAGSVAQGMQDCSISPRCSTSTKAASCSRSARHSKPSDDHSTVVVAKKFRGNKDGSGEGKRVGRRKTKRASADGEQTT
ncbi:condensin-2 complex subunit D3-like [Ornithodoros turicata]|uniref:condensin-2 complex subunit D3-like n=1 Tax=Ornithodoros turicata TaxID=34597 RepID=UPI003139B42E